MKVFNFKHDEHNPKRFASDDVDPQHTSSLSNNVTVFDEELNDLQNAQQLKNFEYRESEDVKKARLSKHLLALLFVSDSNSSITAVVQFLEKTEDELGCLLVFSDGERKMRTRFFSPFIQEMDALELKPREIVNINLASAIP